MVTEIRERVVVATSSRAVDDPIASYCGKSGLKVFRGEVNDVAGRTLQCAQSEGADYFFRINGDSPFVEPALLSTAHRLAEAGRYELVTNLYPRSFPYGVSVELLHIDAFSKAYARMTKPDFFEHVTQYFYEDMSRVNYYNITAEEIDRSGVRLVVDTAGDLKKFERLVKRFEDRWETMSYKEALAFYRTEKFDQ